MAVDPTYQTKNYEGQGGATWVVGGSLEIVSGGTIQVDAGASMTFGANAVAASGALRAGQHTVTSGEVSGLAATIATGLTTLVSMVVMIIRSNKAATVDATVTFSTGTISVASGSTYTLTAADIINWIAVGS